MLLLNQCYHVPLWQLLGNDLPEYDSVLKDKQRRDSRDLNLGLLLRLRGYELVKVVLAAFDWNLEYTLGEMDGIIAWCVIKLTKEQQLAFGGEFDTAVTAVKPQRQATEDDYANLPGKELESIVVRFTKRKFGTLKGYFFEPVWVYAYSGYESVSPHGELINWNELGRNELDAMFDAEYDDCPGIEEYDTESLLSEAYEGDEDAWICRNS